MNTLNIESFVKITEGINYPFLIKGIVTLPDNHEYFVLVDPNKVKHLLETKYYQHYHLEAGQHITCRIDKINCNGKIYIEPLHPFYRLGKTYEFPVTKILSSEVNKKDNQVVFEDIFCNEIKLPANIFPESLKVGQLVKLKVIRIKKGQVFLSEPGFEIDQSGLIEGDEYVFKIADFIEYPGNRSYFIIISNNGSKYKLRSKFYEKYGLAVGQTIYCRLLKSGNEMFFEPRHPYYMINEQYEFEVLGTDVIPAYPQGEKKVLVLRNDYGKNVFLPIKDETQHLIQENKIQCRVKDIRKSKLVLDCLQ